MDSGKRGGDLDYFQRGRMTGEFEVVAFGLPVGGLSEPFKTEYGYHIVQVLDHRPLPFDKVRPALDNLRARKRFEEVGKTAVQLNVVLQTVDVSRLSSLRYQSRPRK